MTSEEDSIEQAALARREALKALRAAKELMSTPDEDSIPTETKDEEPEEIREEELMETNDKNMPNLKFRNYLPNDKRLQEGKVAPPVLPKFEDPVSVAPSTEKVEDPFVNIAPKKPNWDLRRDVQKRLDKLQRRTQKAIFQLMEEQEKENQVLAEENGDSISSD